MFTMKQACQQTGLSYETLKFYCNQGLVPHVQRDSLNRRIFSQQDIDWINSLNCLKNCNMGIREMQEYIALCQQGIDSIPTRQEILARKRGELKAQLKQVQASIDYIDWKQGFYADILSGKLDYNSYFNQED